MSVLSLIYAPDPIFKKKAEAVTQFDETLKAHAQDLLDTLEYEQGVGMASPMVGVLQRIIVTDLQEGGISAPRVFVNPVIIAVSSETQTHEEASLCFPGIGAEVTRPLRITLQYHTVDGETKTEEAEGFFASVIQHEMDYLDGRTYLDHLSKLKKDTLMRKMQKHMKKYPPHVHGEHCHH